MRIDKKIVDVVFFFWCPLGCVVVIFDICSFLIAWPWKEDADLYQDVEKKQELYEDEEDDSDDDDEVDSEEEEEDSDDDEQVESDDDDDEDDSGDDEEDSEDDDNAFVCFTNQGKSVKVRIGPANIAEKLLITRIDGSGDTSEENLPAAAGTDSVVQTHSAVAPGFKKLFCNVHPRQHLLHPCSRAHRNPGNEPGWIIRASQGKTAHH